MATRIIHVHADWAGLGGPVPLGELRVDVVRGRETYAFTYADGWLRHGARVSLDPGLQLFSGPQYPAADREAFGMFLDSAPDRWGRTLMQRREAALARNEERPARRLLESDHLLGVADLARMGALRFSLAPHGPFLATDHAGAIPPIARLRRLQQAAWTVEDDDADDAEHDPALDLLLAPGSSLGGARPKASVVDPDGRLWIAKFPSRGDAVDKGAWEYVVHRLAQRCGVVVPEAGLLRFGRGGHTFLSRRFDRDKSGSRIHFASAMTLLGRRDGDDGRAGASYLELAELLMRSGARVNEDLAQLWTRIVFHICVGNTDDHLRNHGLLLTPDGWRLSPAYDLNPEPDGAGLSLNIDEHDDRLSLELAISVAHHFRVDAGTAARRAKRIAGLVGKHWHELATEAGIGRTAIEGMAHAFRTKP